MTKQYIQIIPASGWYAQFTSFGVTERYPLACIALYKDDEGNTGIEGIMGMESMECPDKDDDFDRYVHRAEFADDSSTDKATLSVGESENGWKHIGYFDRGDA